MKLLIKFVRRFLKSVAAILPKSPRFGLRIIRVSHLSRTAVVVATLVRTGFAYLSKMPPGPATVVHVDRVCVPWRSAEQLAVQIHRVDASTNRAFDHVVLGAWHDFLEVG